jgi:hypothetical protein
LKCTEKRLQIISTDKIQNGLERKSKRNLIEKRVMMLMKMTRMKKIMKNLMRITQALKQQVQIVLEMMKLMRIRLMKQRLMM